MNERVEERVGRRKERHMNGDESTHELFGALFSWSRVMFAIKSSIAGSLGAAGAFGNELVDFFLDLDCLQQFFVSVFRCRGRRKRSFQATPTLPLLKNDGRRSGQQTYLP